MTRDLKDTFLRNISSTLGWNSPRKPPERTTPHGDFPVGERGTVLLEGGRWLLSFGRNLTNYNPDYHGALLAHDLDSPRFASTIIYKNTSPEHDMVPVKIFAQVDRSQSCLAFTVGLLFYRNNSRKVFHSHRTFECGLYNHTKKRLYDSMFLESSKVAVVPRPSVSHPQSTL
jgi:hypothetical protein